jgi:hypothetical protein
LSQLLQLSHSPPSRFASCRYPRTRGSLLPFEDSVRNPTEHRNRQIRRRVLPVEVRLRLLVCEADAQLSPVPRS